MKKKQSKKSIVKIYNNGYYHWDTLDFDENHRFRVKDLIEKCWENDEWRKEDYNVISIIAKNFSKIIKITRVGKDYIKYHNISLVNFPTKIIEAFEII